MAQRIACTTAEYHAMDGVSHSRMEVALESLPEYYGRFVARTIPPKVTKDLEWGQQVHAHILEQGVVGVPVQYLSRNGALAGKRVEALRQVNPGKLLVRPDVWEKLQACERSLRAHARAASLLWPDDPDAESEVTIAWRDLATGLDCRVRLDKVVRRPKLLCDLKTGRAVSPRRFALACEAWGYHRQAALYQAAWEELTGERLPFVFVAIAKTHPYLVEVYELDQEWIDAGHRENRIILERLAECFRTGQWHAETHHKIMLLRRPRYAGFAEEWRLDDE